MPLPKRLLQLPLFGDALPSARGIVPAEQYGITMINGRPVKLIDPMEAGPRTDAGKWLRKELVTEVIPEYTDAQHGFARAKVMYPDTHGDYKRAHQREQGLAMVAKAIKQKLIKDNPYIDPEGLGAMVLDPNGHVGSLLAVRGPDVTGYRDAAFLDYLGATPRATRGEATKLFGSTIEDSDVLVPNTVKDVFLTPLLEEKYRGRPDTFYKKTFPASEYISPADFNSDPFLRDMLGQLGEAHNAGDLGVTRIPIRNYAKGGKVATGALAAIAAAMGSDDAQAGWPAKVVKTAKGALRLEHYDPADLKAMIAAGMDPQITGPIDSEGKRLANLATKGASFYGRLPNADSNLIMAKDPNTGRVMGALRFTGKGPATIEEFGTFPSRSGTGDAMMQYLAEGYPAPKRLTTSSDNIPFYSRHGFRDAGQVPWSDSIRNMETP